MKKIVSALILALAVSFVLPAMAEDKKEVAKVVVKASVVKAAAKAVVKPVAKDVFVVPASQPVKPEVKAETAVPATEVKAAEPTISEWWKVALRYALEIIFSILGIVATGFVTVLMKKYGFEAYTDKVETILTQATGYAEQKSAQALKLNGKPLGAAEKMALALSIAEAEAKEHKLAERGKVWWEAKLEGWLGTAKLGG